VSRAARIVMTGLRKQFTDIARGEEIVAIERMDLEIADDEFLTILGPSGCGKTTLLNIVAGFERASAGDLRLDGERIAAPGPDRGVVFQEYALFPWLTVEQNIEFGLRERRVRRAERMALVRRQIASVGLSGFEKRYPQELSGGMRQRVALARVLVNDPKILLMDEPFAALDAQTRDLMQVELLAIWQQARKTVLFVTHQIEEAVYLSDRVMVMTKRPGQAKKLFDIPLPRPRDYEMRVTPQFNDLKLAIWQTLKDEISV